MHIVLVETTAVCGFDIVEEMVNAGIEVSFVAQDLKRHLALHDPAKVKRAARLIEVPELGQPCDLATLLRDKLGPNKPDGVICRDEIFARDVANLTQAYGLPGESDATAVLLSDKSAVRDCLKKAGLGSLQWRRVRSVEEALQAGREIGYPLVVKPVSGGFSLGVTIVSDEQGLAAALVAAEQASGGAAAGQAVVLLEEFASGKLVSAEMLVQNGQPLLLGFAERLPCPPGVTAEIGGHFPARFEQLDAARTFAENVVRALGIRNSAVHMEMMITPKGPELVEVNGRIAGYVVMQQMSHALARSITMDLVAVATGTPLAPLGEPVATVAIRPLWSDRAGTVTDILPPAPLSADIVMHGLSVKPGSRVAPLRSNSDRFGFVMALGVDQQDATETAAQDAQQLLQRLVIVPDGEAQSSNAASASQVERSERTHVLLLDRVGPIGWTLRDGSPLLPPERYRLSVITSSGDGGNMPCAAPDFITRMDVFDHAAVASAANAIHADFPIQRVATLSERLLAPAAALRRRFDAPGDTPVMVNRFIDKAVMKQLARRAGIRCAEGHVVHTPGDLLQLLKRHAKIVVKPRAASGSQGVAMIACEMDAHTWLEQHYVASQFLAEGFVEGEMCHIDALVWNGAISWDMSCYLRDTMAYQRGQPLSSVTVGDAQLRAAAGELLHQVVDAWQVRAAVLHLEAFVNSNGLVFCEVAARPGGAGVVEAFEATRGINLDHAKILLDCGEDPRRLHVQPAAEHAGYTVHYCHAGVLEHFDDSQVAERAFHRRVAALPGQTVLQSRFSGTGLSTHIFAGDTPQAVLDLIRQAESSIRFSVRPQQQLQEQV